VVLSGSSCQGPSIRVACNRHFLRRVVQLGFREVLIRNATTPLLCRDDRRTYLYMPLEAVLPPAADAVRIVSSEAAPVALNVNPKPQGERRREAMPRPPLKDDQPPMVPPHLHRSPCLVRTATRWTRSSKPRRCVPYCMMPSSG
jgi:hypothetical protein